VLGIAGLKGTVLDSKELDAERKRLDDIQMSRAEPMEIDASGPSSRGRKRKREEQIDVAPVVRTIEMLLNDPLVDKVALNSTHIFV